MSSFVSILLRNLCHCYSIRGFYVAVMAQVPQALWNWKSRKATDSIVDPVHTSTVRAITESTRQVEESDRIVVAFEMARAEHAANKPTGSEHG